MKVLIFVVFKKNIDDAKNKVYLVTWGCLNDPEQDDQPVP